MPNPRDIEEQKSTKKTLTFYNQWPQITAKFGYNQRTLLTAMQIELPIGLFAPICARVATIGKEAAIESIGIIVKSSGLVLTALFSFVLASYCNSTQGGQKNKDHYYFMLNLITGIVNMLGAFGTLLQKWCPESPIFKSLEDNVRVGFILISTLYASPVLKDCCEAIPKHDVNTQTKIRHSVYAMLNVISLTGLVFSSATSSLEAALNALLATTVANFGLAGMDLARQIRDCILERRESRNKDSDTSPLLTAQEPASPINPKGSTNRSPAPDYGSTTPPPEKVTEGGTNQIASLLNTATTLFYSDTPGAPQPSTTSAAPPSTSSSTTTVATLSQ